MPSNDGVPSGPLPPLPTIHEISELYPPVWSWDQLKDMIDTGSLELLKRHPDLEIRYQEFCTAVTIEYGSVGSYLLNVRLGWGPPKSFSSTLPPLAPMISDAPSPFPVLSPIASRAITPVPPVAEYFTYDIASGLVKGLKNDWPYLVPTDITHYVVWSRVPIIHPAIIPESAWSKVMEDGLYGFTGGPTRTKQQPEDVKKAGEQIMMFVKQSWNENQWETAWFLNPTRIQSVKALVHFHVFARRKGEIVGQ